MAIIQFENGTKVNFNGDPTPQDVEEVAKKLGIQKSQNSTTPPPDNSFSGLFANRGNQAIEATNRFKAGQQGDTQTAYQFLGAGAGFIKDAASKVYQDTGLSKAVPYVNDKILPAIIPGLANVKASKQIIQPQIDQLKQGIGNLAGNAYQNIKTKYPGPTATAEALGNVAQVVGTAYGAKDLLSEPLKGLLPNKQARSFQTAVDAIKPDLKGKAAASSYIKDFGAGTQKSGLFTAQEAAATPQIKQVANNLQDLLKSKNPLKNLQSLGRGMNQTESQLNVLLEADKTPVIRQSVTDGLEELKKNIPREYTGIREQQGTFNKVVDFAKEKVNGAAPDVKGLIRDARPSFDNQAKMEFPSAYKNGYIDTATPAGRAIKLVRDYINEYAYNTAEQGSELQRLIKREADIFKATQNVGPKVAANEGKTSLSKVVENIKKHPVITTVGTLGAGYGIGRSLTK